MIVLLCFVLMILLCCCGSYVLCLWLNFNFVFYVLYLLYIVDFMLLVLLYGDLQDDCVYFCFVIDVIGLQVVSMVKWFGMVFDLVEVFEVLCD